MAKFGGTTLMNAQNDKGNTGLHFLVQYGYTELAESARRSRPQTPSQDSHLANRCIRASPAKRSWRDLAEYMCSIVFNEAAFGSRILI